MKLNVAAPILDYDGTEVVIPVQPKHAGEPMTTRPLTYRDVMARALDAAATDAKAEEKFRMFGLGISLYTKDEIDIDATSAGLILDACSRPPCTPIAYGRIRMAIEAAQAEEAVLVEAEPGDVSNNGAAEVPATA